MRRASLAPAMTCHDCSALLYAMNSTSGIDNSSHDIAEVANAVLVSSRSNASSQVRLASNHRDRELMDGRVAPAATWCDGADMRVPRGA